MKPFKNSQSFNPNSTKPANASSTHTNPVEFFNYNPDPVIYVRTLRLVKSQLISPIRNSARLKTIQQMKLSIL